jgi:hypothetical protein
MYMNQKPLDLYKQKQQNCTRNKSKYSSLNLHDREGAEWVVREGVGAGGRNEPSLVCTYE